MNISFHVNYKPPNYIGRKAYSFSLTKEAKIILIYIFFFKFDFKIITNSQFIFFHVIYVGRFIFSTKGFTLGSQLTVLE